MQLQMRTPKMRGHAPVAPASLLQIARKSPRFSRGNPQEIIKVGGLGKTLADLAGDPPPTKGPDSAHHHNSTAPMPAPTVMQTLTSNRTMTPFGLGALFGSFISRPPLLINRGVRGSGVRTVSESKTQDVVRRELPKGTTSCVLALISGFE
jgi:hypothetical protein